MKHRYMNKTEAELESARIERKVYAVALGGESYEKIEAPSSTSALSITGGHVARRMGTHESLEQAAKRLGWT